MFVQRSVVYCDILQDAMFIYYPEGFLPLLTYKTSFENTTWEVKNYITISIEYFEQLHRLRVPTLQ